MGVAPHYFMTRRRIERAKELLLHSDQPLAEIALAVGFSSQAHFTDQFRKMTGSTPLRFRTATDSQSNQASLDVTSPTLQYPSVSNYNSVRNLNLK